MIKPLAECETSHSFFVVLDIENWPDGTVLTVTIAWRGDNGEIECKTFGEWSTFWEWLIPVARDDKRFRTIYAHNGGGWDWLSLSEYLLGEGSKSYLSLFASTAASKMITLTVHMESRFTVHFCDSLQLLRSPLATLAKKFNVTNKVDIGGKLPHEIYQQDRAVFHQYITADVAALLEILEKALALVRDNVARIDTFGYTIGATALKIFKTMGIQNPITIPWEPGVKNFLREGYRGGRVEMFKAGYYENVKIYDVNSLYPYAMLTTEVPVTDRGRWVDEFQNAYPCGVYKIRFVQKRLDVPPILMVAGVGKYDGNGIYYANEIRLLREIDPGADIHVERGYVFHDSEKVFQSFVNTLYNLRLSDPDGPISLLAKYLLNSLYGKFGQHSEREQILKLNDPDERFKYIPRDGVSRLRELSEKTGTHILTKDSECKFEHVGIAGTITSAARCILYRGMLSAGVDNVVYCDTDSVHTTKPIRGELIGKEIGKFKLEFNGEGVYCGKKLYALRDSNQNEKIRAKGVSVGGRNGCRLGFDDFIAMSAGKSIECFFQQPATALQVFSGQKTACKFGPRKRTIRRL